MDYSGFDAALGTIASFIFFGIGLGITFATILLAINRSKASRHLENIEFLLEDIRARMIEKEDESK